MTGLGGGGFSAGGVFDSAERGWGRFRKVDFFRALTEKEGFARIGATYPSPAENTRFLYGMYIASGLFPCVFMGFIRFMLILMWCAPGIRVQAFGPLRPGHKAPPGDGGYFVAL